MFKKLLIFSFVGFVALKTFHYFENKMLNDDAYLLTVIKNKRSQQANELVNASINEAKRYIKQGDYESALEYYVYVYKIMGCDWNYLMSSVDDIKMKNMLEIKKEELCGNE
ncbi:hypothetical protein BDAP_002262 [Binucleata daphniae]